jgi:hypothetical protein
VNAPKGLAACLAAAALAAPAAAGAHQAILGRTSFPCGPQSTDGTNDGSIQLKGIKVWARPKGGGPVAARDTTGKRGRFRLDLEPGRWVVHFQKIENAGRPRPRRVHLHQHEFPFLDVSYDVQPACL